MFVLENRKLQCINKSPFRGSVFAIRVWLLKQIAFRPAEEDYDQLAVSPHTLTNRVFLGGNFGVSVEGTRFGWFLRETKALFGFSLEKENQENKENKENTEKKEKKERMEEGRKEGRKERKEERKNNGNKRNSEKEEEKKTQ